MEQNPYQSLFEKQKNFFLSKHKTASVYQRKLKLKKLKKWIKENEQAICDAIYADFKKVKIDVLLSEIKPVIQEINDAIKNLYAWSDNQPVTTPLYLFGAKGKVKKEPKGACLIIAPWNFPFNLTIGPLVSAIAAGNTIVIKPSEVSQNTEKLIVKLIQELFEEQEIAVVTGGVEETQQLLKLKWNHIFFTGSPQVGKIVMKAASDTLASVTLELGGKNPVIVDETASIKDAAKKLAWGKFFNCGQSCVSPNYIFVHEKVIKQFETDVVYYTEKYFGKNPKLSDFPRIINGKHHERLTNDLKASIEEGGFLHTGNQSDPSDNYLSPTILTVGRGNSILNNEIFGPIMPLIEYSDVEEVIQYINNEENPLALYVFSKNNKNINHIINSTTAGTTAINETTVQFIHPHLPFGGTNFSGIGKAHGKYGFDAFSNDRAILRQRRGLTSTQIAYPPFTPLKQKIIRFVTWWL